MNKINELKKQINDIVKIQNEISKKIFFVKKDVALLIEKIIEEQKSKIDNV